MPIYEYYCEDTQCNHEFEKMLGISSRDAPTIEPCPECGNKTVKKGVSATTMGVDMNFTPDKATGGDWSRLMDKVKKATSPKDHDRLDSYTDNNAGHFGPR